MRIGKLRYRVQIQAATEGTDKLHGVTETWTTAVTVWASLRDLSGRELVQGEATEGQTTAEIGMRYNTTVTAKHRLRVLRPDSTVWRTFGIHSIIVDERRRGILCRCTENARG